MRHLIGWHQGGIFCSVPDCPEPEFIEHARVRENEAGSSKRSNYTDREGQNPQENLLHSKLALKIIPDNVTCAKRNEEERGLFHQGANSKQQAAAAQSE